MCVAFPLHPRQTAACGASLGRGAHQRKAWQLWGFFFDLATAESFRLDQQVQAPVRLIWLFAVMYRSTAPIHDSPPASRSPPSPMQLSP